MVSNLRILLFCLAALATGLAQVLGVQSGYVCGCTGKQSVEATCGTELCHSEEVQSESSCSENVAADTNSLIGRDGSKQLPDHTHRELREQLVVTGFSPIAALPETVLYFLPWAFQSPDYRMLDTVRVEGEECPGPPEYGSPPMPLLVAETVVILV